MTLQHPVSTYVAEDLQLPSAADITNIERDFCVYIHTGCKHQIFSKHLAEDLLPSAAADITNIERDFCVLVASTKHCVIKLSILSYYNNAACRCLTEFMDEFKTCEVVCHIPSRYSKEKASKSV